LNDNRYLAYVWAESPSGQRPTPSVQGPRVISARFFFPHGTAIAEDPATGSACANLGGWFVATDAALPVSKTIQQGAAIKRPSRLYLHVDANKTIFVSGEVIEVASGVLTL
jgi:PhzF family phenazine biosynthesis protein